MRSFAESRRRTRGRTARSYPIYSWILSAFGDAAPFNFQRVMNTGQTIDFVVDVAGNYANDTTELKAGVIKK